MMTDHGREPSQEQARLGWPQWPLGSPEVEAACLRVLRSGRWAVSGMSSGAESEERKFAAEWARFLGADFSVPTANGSSAIVACLESAGVSYGDEVLVPGLSWVACASAVARVGAVPVFVDLDAESYGMDPIVAEALISKRTAAVLLTHLSSSIADIDSFQRICADHGLILIEDCSQAHGAVWRGSRVGSFGDFAAFSFQSSKLLTAGEGGAAVARTERNFMALQEARADGRSWSNEPARKHFPDLAVGSSLCQGHNFCMTEFQAAILRESLRHLDGQNRKRIERVALLEELLEGIPGVRTVRRRNDPRVDVPTFWHLPIQIEASEFGGADAERVRCLLSERVGLYLEPVGAPIPAHDLYRPGLYNRFPREHIRLLKAQHVPLPISSLLSETCFTLPHHALLADESCITEFADRLSEVRTDLIRERA